MCAKVLRNMVIRANCTCECVENGAKAVEVLKSMEAGTCTYHFVLMDLRMPVMDGFEATRIAKKELLLDRLPFVAVSAEMGFDTRLMCEAVGFDGTSSKPMTFEILKALIKEHAMPALMHA